MFRLQPSPAQLSSAQLSLLGFKLRTLLALSGQLDAETFEREPGLQMSDCSGSQTAGSATRAAALKAEQIGLRRGGEYKFVGPSPPRPQKLA